MELTVPENTEAERLDSYIARNVETLTRATVQRLVETGMITVDGKSSKPSLKLKGGEHIAIVVPPPVEAAPAPEHIPLEVLYEDHEVVVVNKAAGMVVHPGAGTDSGTLVNALLGHCTDLSGIGGEIRPGIVHRIDKDTSGILVVAKNDAAHLALSEQFREHSIKRIYYAIVYGALKGETGRLESVIGRHPTDRKRMSGKARHGKHAVTHWRVIGRYPGMTLIRLRLETGRTHQIRVHLSEAGHPLVGDEVYGGGARLASVKDPVLRRLIKELGRQALHAKTLGFIHPATKEFLEFDTELPQDMAAIVEHLESTSSAN